jgi:hypothetical protein
MDGAPWDHARAPIGGDPVIAYVVTRQWAPVVAPFIDRHPVEGLAASGVPAA